MPNLHVSQMNTNIATASYEVVLAPMDLGEMPIRAFTIQNSGTHALADLKIQRGPTNVGPWSDEDLTATGLQTLAGGAHEDYKPASDSAFRWWRVTAKGAGADCDIKVWLDAIG